VILLADLETPSSSRCSADRKAVFRKNRKSTNLPATAGEKAKSLVPPEDPYGRTTLVSGSNLATFQYTHDYYHATSGLNLTKYRAYDPNTARWLSRDPLKNAEMRLGPNLYEYVKNDPINLVDPLGLCPCNSKQPYQGDNPPGQVPWNTPPFTPSNNPYGNATFAGVPLVNISNAFGNNTLSNCIRGCLSSAWNPCTQSYTGTLVGSHALCISICMGSQILGEGSGGW
jgi:RHS repeat-associated protein